MKYLIGLLLLATPLSAAAYSHDRYSFDNHYRHHHHQEQAPSPTPQPPVQTPSPSNNPPPVTTPPVTLPPVTPPSSICFDYGHQPLVNGNYDSNQVSTDLSVLK